MKLRGTILIADGQKDGAGDSFTKEAVQVETLLNVLEDNQPTVIGVAQADWEGDNLVATVQIDESHPIAKLHAFGKTNGTRVPATPSVTGVIFDRNEDGAIKQCKITAVSFSTGLNSDKRIGPMEIVNDA